MTAIKNIHDLKLQRQKLKYEEKLLRKEISSVSADVLEDLNFKLRDFAFDLSSRLMLEFIKSVRRKKRARK